MVEKRVNRTVGFVFFSMFLKPDLTFLIIHAAFSRGGYVDVHDYQMFDLILCCFIIIIVILCSKSKSEKN